MRDSRRVKAILASASIFVVAGVANAVTDTWVGNVAPTNGLTYPANTGNWDKTTANWNNGGTDLYTVGDNTVFTDNFSGFTTLALAGTMNPNSIEFAHVGSTPTNYVFLVSGALSLLGDTGTSSSPWQGGIVSPPTMTLDAGFLGSVDLQARATSAADGGGTFINSGKVIIEDAGALIPYTTNNNPNVTIGGGGTLEININDTVIGGSNTQPSSSQLKGNLNVISSSTLQLGAANSSRMWDGMINLSPGATLFMNSIVSSADEMDLAATILGPGTISLGSSSSVLRLDTAGSAGTTFDTGTGTAVLRNDLGNGGTVNLGALTGGSGTFLDGSESSATAATTYSIGALASSTFQGTIRDEATNAATTSITKVGSSTLTLTNNNTYSGTTTVNNGSLVGTASNTNPTPSGTPFGVGPIALNGGTLSVAPTSPAFVAWVAGASATAGTQFTYGGGGTLALNRGSTVGVTFTVGNSSPTVGLQVINRSGQGTLVIAPANGTAATNLGLHETFIANTTTAGNLPVVTNGIVNTSIVGQNNDANLSGDFLTYSATAGFVLGAYTDTNFATPLSTSVELVNTPQVSLASTNVFALNTSANIAMGAGNTLTIGSVASAQAGLILNGGSISGSTSTLTFSPAEGTIYTSLANGSISTSITGVGLLTFFGPGALTISGNDSDTGTHNINSGTLILTGNNSAATGATNVNQNATLQLQANAGNTSGGINNALSQSAAELQLLNNSTVQLRADAPTTFYNNTSGISMNNRSVTFDVNQLTGAGTNNALTFAPAGFSANGSVINVTGGNGYSLVLGPISDASSSSVDTMVPTTASLSVGGFTSAATATGTVTLDLDGTSTGNSVGGVISNNASVGTAIVALVKSNTSTWTLSNANTYTGGTAINGGVLSLNNSTALGPSGNISFGSTTVFTGGTLQFTSNNTNDYSGRIQIADMVTATVDTNGQNVAFASPFLLGGAKQGAFTKTGLGTLTMSAANTYTGVTTLNNGELSIANATGSATGTGNVILNGGILASSATTAAIAGSVVAGTGSHTIAPGGIGAVGSLAIGGLTSTSLTTLNFDLGTGAGEITNGDLLTLGTGTLLVGAGAANVGVGTLMTFTGPTAIGNDYRLIGDNNAGVAVDAITLTNFSLPAAPVGQAFSLSNSVDAGFIDLVVAAAGPVSLTWNNAGGALPSDGQTWDINADKNWNNGSSPNTVYTNGSNVTFNDTNNNGSNPNAYNVTLSTLVSPASVTVNNTTGNYTISGNGTIGGTGSLTKSGTGMLTLSTPNSYSGGTIVTAGKLVIGQAGSNATFTGLTLTGANTLTALPTGKLSISGNGIVQLADGVTNQTFVTPSAHSAVVTSNINLTTLSLTGDGTLDIGNNRIIIDYTTGNDPIATIKQWIAAGFSDGDVAGAQPAIISSDIAADDTASGFSYGIGYADGADGVIAGLPSGEIEIMFTLLGDANLDGQVNTEDFTPFSTNLSKNGSWDQGDFNYDGSVNTEDFTPFSHDLSQTASFAASEDGALASPLIGAGGISLANVPEPTTIGLVAIASCGLLARRRRSSR